MTTDFDVVVLGAGSGGYACALRAAQLGMSVALVERDLVGGTCLHRGCIPAKAVLHSAEVADAARHAGDVGVRASFDGVDMPAVRAYTQSVVKRLHTGLKGLLRQRGVQVVEGTGTLVSDAHGTAVAVGGQRLTGHRIVLATGSRPRTLGLPVDHQRILTSDDALWLDTLPSSAIVLGGGVIGVEIASAWASFGVQVTIVEALDRLVAAETAEISQALQRAFTKRGITVRSGTALSSAQSTDSGVEVVLADSTQLQADVLLVAVGREPVTEAITPVEFNGAWVQVDADLTTSLPTVYAVGDLVPGPQLAHRGFGHGMFLADLFAHLDGRTGPGLTGRRPQLAPDSGIPRITYCQPTILSVGLTPEQARQNGEVEVVRYDLTGNGRAQILRTQGFVQVVRAADGPVVGVHAIGEGVDEIAGEAQLVVNWQAFPDDVAQFVHAHPSVDEAFGEAVFALAGRPLHTH